MERRTLHINAIKSVSENDIYNGYKYREEKAAGNNLHTSNYIDYRVLNAVLLQWTRGMQYLSRTRHILSSVLDGIRSVLHLTTFLSDSRQSPFRQ